jgi:metal-responsive CopG/Arc/MetJ family transcriptional regulator
MKAIQVVVDEELLERVDRSAKRLKSSRSAAFRALSRSQRRVMQDLAREERCLP